MPQAYSTTTRLQVGRDGGEAAAAACIPHSSRAGGVGAAGDGRSAKLLPFMPIAESNWTRPDGAWNAPYRCAAPWITV
jgi:hypothetical protein